ncbi:DUF2187 domain-containing protein [Bacillus sp. CDB3]|uniref:DUF2187 domain-containing protein n=1 Tax=Bacillus sp. CDB3 TaxID=360310 RepID=UPI0009D85F7F|nr:DUF2187 domain-containing protein [Bacillus sp. CDB3]OQR53314.1 DUF2187 domain-containing protein [Bacillus sp. CDB3]
MENEITVSIGEYVQFPYRKNPSLQLTGYVVSVLMNTIVVDVSEIMGIEESEIDDVRQVIKHGGYNKIAGSVAKFKNAQKS